MGAYESDELQSFGDFDGNERWDLGDTAALQICSGAPMLSPEWVDTWLCVFDFDEMGSVDLYDFAHFADALTGP